MWLDISMIAILFIVIFGSIADMLVSKKEYVSKVFLILIAGLLLCDKAFNETQQNINTLYLIKIKQEERIKALEEKQENLEKKIEEAIANKPLILKRNQEN